MNLLFGYENGELIGKNPSLLNAGTKPEFITKMIVLKIMERGFWEGELRGRKKDGTVFSTYARISAFRDEHNKITNYISTQHDISEIRSLEKQCKQSEVKYRTLFECAPIALGKEDWSELKKYVERIKKSGIEDLSSYLEDRKQDLKNLTLELKNIRINNAVLELHEVESKEEYLKCRLKTSTEETYHFLKRILIDIAAGKTSYEGEFPIRTLRGNLKFIRFRWTVAPGHEKTYSMVFVYATDLTARKKMEMQLKRSEALLREQKETLEQKNIALREILSQIEAEKDRIKCDISENLSSVLYPVLERHKNKTLKTENVDLIKHHIEELASSYGIKLKSGKVELTPKEKEICSLVKGGLSNKEIAEFLCVSCRTVEKHRESIRRKLGISKKDINLTSHLHNMGDSKTVTTF